jgi:sortase A
MSDALRTALRGVGQTLITVGLVLLLFCVYELWVTNLVTAREQDRLSDELRREWADPPARPTPTDDLGAVAVAVELGTGVAVLRVPRLGDDWNAVVVEGTSLTDLKKGPGRMIGTAQPGEVGNAVISGHRTTYGAPFADLDALQPGDAVVVETRDAWFTYRVTASEIVTPTSVEVTLPVPGQPDAEPTQRLLTLTTCHPKYSARQRLVVYSELEQELPKADGEPAALQEG